MGYYGCKIAVKNYSIDRFASGVSNIFQDFI